MVIDYRTLAFELWDATGHMTRIRFRPDQHDLVDAARERHVTVVTQPCDASENAELALVSLHVVTWDRDFYKNPTVEELAAAQGWQPVEGSLVGTEGLWEEGEVDKFLAAVETWRRTGQ